MSTESSTSCNCGESCGQSCSESCSRSCNESCNENCNKSCSNCCQESCNNCFKESCNNCCQQSCGCSSSSTEGQTLFIVNSSVIFVNVILGIINDFNSHIPIFLTLFGSILLGVSLSGFRGFIKQDAINQFEKSTHHVLFGRLLFHHSHHCETDILKGKEFSFKEKYYCTGCYGLLFGTIISIVIFCAYLIWPLYFTFTQTTILIIPFFFLPIVIRYTIMKNMSTFLRFFSNASLPVGCSILFIIMDSNYSSWLLNSLIVIFILSVAVLRGYISSKG